MNKLKKNIIIKKNNFILSNINKNNNKLFKFNTK